MEIFGMVSKKEQARHLVRRGYPMVSISHILSVNPATLQKWIESDNLETPFSLPINAAVNNDCPLTDGKSFSGAV